MEYLKFSRPKIDDFFGMNSRKELSTWKTKKLDLDKISETNESLYKTKSSNIFNEILTENSIKHMKPQKKIDTFFTIFFQKLKQHEKIFHYFAQEATLLGILKNCSGKSPTYLKSIEKKGVKKLLLSSNASDYESEISYSSPKYLKSLETHSQRLLLKNLMFKKPHPSESRPTSSSSSRYIHTPISKFRGIIQKKKEKIDVSNHKLKEIFDKICGNRSKTKIDSEDFKCYLEIRYPSAVADTISKYFSFKLTSFEDYVHEMKKFSDLREEKHLKFCFDIFDFNKDSKICYKDAFTALELRTDNYYDFDFAIIKEMLMLKKQGKLDNKKLRRKSTFSMMKEKLEKIQRKKVEDFKRLTPEPKIPIEKGSEINPYLDFKEFRMIKFNGRPQILKDFLQYTCDYDYMAEKNLYIPAPVHSNRGSELVVMEMNISQDFHEIIRKNDKYEYYCALDSAMSLYKKQDLENLLSKFKYLQSDEKFKYKVITKDSMKSKLVILTQPDLLGYKNDYFSVRFYEYLSDGTDLTKLKFLHKLHPFFKNCNDLLINKLAFELYDSRNDGKLTADEICNMFNTLPIGSAVYIECEKMIDLFSVSIFDRLRQGSLKIDFVKFIEIVEVSCMGFEIIEMIKSNLDIGRQSIYFQTQSLSYMQLEKHQKLTNQLTELT